MMRALVVDDSLAMRRLIQRTLESSGWVVGTARDGADALSTLESAEEHDLVVTDWHMPGMDGIALVTAIRKSPRLKALKVIMVTSEAVMPMIDAALTAGVDDFVMKPFTPEALSERVAEIVGG